MCSCKSLGCGCDIQAELIESQIGLGSSEGQSLLNQVISTLKMIPGAGHVQATAAKVQAVYDVITNRSAVELDREFTDYKKKVSTMNAALLKIDKDTDEARRQQNFSAHRKAARTVSQYGTALAEEINAHNALAKKIEDLTIGKITPTTVSLSGFPRLNVPNLSDLGLGPLIVIPIAAAVAVGAIALVLYKSMSSVESYMHYDLKRRGIKEGMDREYDGWTGGIQKAIEKTGGTIMTAALVGGAAFIGYLALKRYLPKAKKTFSPARLS